MESEFEMCLKNLLGALCVKDWKKKEDICYYDVIITSDSDVRSFYVPVHSCVLKLDKE